MFEAAKAVMRPEMVVGGWRLGSGGLEAEVVMFGGSACSMASQVVRLASQVVRLASQVVRLASPRVHADKKGFSPKTLPRLVPGPRPPNVSVLRERNKRSAT